MGCGASSAAPSDNAPLKSPKDPTFVENALLFLPTRVVARLGIDPNIAAKGETRKTMWLGRVWHLRALLARQYERRKRRQGHNPLSAAKRQELDAMLSDPTTMKKLMRIIALWQGSVTRLRTQLSPLRRVDPADINATVIYAHGSGGCAWDNTRICRMMAEDGYLVIVPDGFAYPADSQMGKLRRKEVAPLLKPTDNTDYWEGDLVYTSGSSGDLTYSTSADAVLHDPEGFRELYEKVFWLRSAELHWIIRAMPGRIKSSGLHLGGTSEGGMAIARFDESRYGHLVQSRFINSFSVEYCYFTPTKEAGRIGGRLSLPTLNIIGSNDEYFGRTRSVAQLVAADAKNGYGNRKLQGHAYDTFVAQRLSRAAVCYLEGGMHSPCTTHDNFLRELLRFFLARPSQIPYLAEVWAHDAPLAVMVRVERTTAREASRAAASPSEVTLLHVPPMKFPQTYTTRQMRTSRLASVHGGAKLALDDKIVRALAEQKAREEAEAARVEGLLNQLQGRVRDGRFRHDPSASGLSLSRVLVNITG